MSETNTNLLATFPARPKNMEHSILSTSITVNNENFSKPILSNVI